jgi:hypothetical protein
MLNYIDLLL